MITQKYCPGLLASSPPPFPTIIWLQRTLSHHPFSQPSSSILPSGSHPCFRRRRHGASSLHGRHRGVPQASFGFAFRWLATALSTRMERRFSREKRQSGRLSRDAGGAGNDDDGASSCIPGAHGAGIGDAVDRAVTRLSFQWIKRTRGFVHRRKWHVTGLWHDGWVQTDDMLRKMVDQSDE